MADEEDDGFEEFSGINWGPGVYQSLLIVALLIATGFSSCNSNVSQLAGPTTGTSQAQSNAGFQGPAPQVAESPSPTPADQPTPVQDQPTPDTGGGVTPGGGGTRPPPAACTPSAPYDIQASTGSVSGSSNGNGGSWTVSGLKANSSLSVSASGMVSCGKHHTLKATTNSPGGTSYDCEPTMGAAITARVKTYTDHDTVSVTLTYDDGC
jgi:hypothetical protein